MMESIVLTFHISIFYPIKGVILKDISVKKAFV